MQWTPIKYVDVITAASTAESACQNQKLESATASNTIVQYSSLAMYAPWCDGMILPMDIHAIK